MANCSNKAIDIRLGFRNLCPILLVVVQPTGLCCSLADAASSAYKLSRKYVHYLSRSYLYMMNIRRFEALMGTTEKNTVFWNMRIYVKNESTFRSSLLLSQSTQKMEATDSVEKLINSYRTMRCPIPEFCILQMSVAGSFSRRSML